MDDIDFNTFISVYQKRLNETVTQSIALEAKVVILSQKVTSLSQQIESLKLLNSQITEELEKTKIPKPRKKTEEFS